ncbi:MAG: preprotein translocase subunit SecA [Proteobacteria bacterium]|nr:preprotein translocase subunit SecA [Pseudomonadota bacterium]
MFGGLIKRFFGTSHERMMRKIQPTVVLINAREAEVAALSDEALAAQTVKFREQVANGASLEDILPEVFATVREVSQRVLGMRHYDVQMIGGVVLHRGMISEMKTGEGKTLVATCPLYLNALLGKGAHLVTVNDYLASRDADWMGQIYRFLGMSVGKILTDLDNEERRIAYNSDITYGTNNEFGFDYLRDNMKFSLADYVQRGHFFGIVDEVDSILIDEARTPLIISGQIEQDLNLYQKINKLVPFLKRDEDYAVDEKAQSVALNESGIEKVERHLGVENIYEPKYIDFLHHVNKALQAHTLYKLDQNYVIENGKVVIVDDFTGRLMHGRRWSDGLHQAVEAKEGVEIQSESRTLATITFQNYFRMYEKLAGMTGTADTEAEEFKKIYKLDVVSIPTEKKIIRKDYQDVVYCHERAKIAAVIKQILECHAKGQPVLVGTVSVEKSEVYSKRLDKEGIPHNVLNAKNHRREAEIIAQAGREGAVTIATNMAGRGTDILLGGNPEFLARQALGNGDPKQYKDLLQKFKTQCAEEKERVVAQGGLFILGTERHESRRIDNQLRGRAGRQGDPGASRFFLSLDDDLMRIFGGEKLKAMMERLGMEEDVPIEAGMVSRSIEGAQKRVEGRNFDIRKSLIEYDDVMNAQRKAIYGLRRNILEGLNIEQEILDAFEDVTYDFANKHLPEHTMYEDWDLEGFFKAFVPIFGFSLKIDMLDVGRGDRAGIIQLVWNAIEAHYNSQIKSFDDLKAAFDNHLGEDSPYKGVDGKTLLLELAQNFYLREIDQLWRDHLSAMTNLRESISLRGYAQKDPKQEYKREAFALFEAMMHNIRVRIMTQVSRVQVEKPKFGDAPKPKASAKSEPVTLAKTAAQPKAAEKSAAGAKPLSMAELTPSTIAQASRAAQETLQKPRSMADMMPASIMKAMQDVASAQKKAIEEFANAQKRQIEALAQGETQNDDSQDDAENTEASKEVSESDKISPLDALLQDDGDSGDGWDKV